MKRIFSILLLCTLSLAFFSSCNDKLEIKNDFDFSIWHLPIPTNIKINQTVEIRFNIQSLEHQYKGTRYFMRYFQFSGKGALSDESNRSFVPNDTYPLEKTAFKLYFTPYSEGEQVLELWFSDNFGHLHSIHLQFNSEK